MKQHLADVMTILFNIPAVIGAVIGGIVSFIAVAAFILSPFILIIAVLWCVL